jgi:hypothetical protein
MGTVAAAARQSAASFRRGAGAAWDVPLPRGEFALLGRGKLKDVPPGIETLQEVLAKYRLTGRD